MPIPCIDELVKASEGTITKEQAKDIVKELRKRAKAKRETDLASKAESIDKAVDEFIEQEERDNLIEKRNAWLNLKVRKDILRSVKEFDNPIDGYMALLGGLNTKSKNSRYSVDTTIKAKIEGMLGAFHNELNKAGVFDVLMDKERQAEIVHALFDKDAVVKPEVRTLANIIDSFYEKSRKEQNFYGADIGKLPEFLGSQTHNTLLMTRPLPGRLESMKLRIKLRQQYGREKMLQMVNDMAFERWKNHILPKLDADKTFLENGIEGDKEINEFLRSAFDRLTTNKEKQGASFYRGSKANDLLKFKGPSNLAKKISQHRLLHFRDGKSWLDYNQMYGNGSLQLTMLHTLEQAGRNIGLMQRLGPNYLAMHNLIKSELEEMALRGKNKKTYTPDQVRRKLKFSDAILGQLDNSLNNPVDSLGARISSSARAWESMSKLGMILISSFNDMALQAALLKDSGETFLGSYAKAFSNIFQSKDKELANSLGVFGRGSFGHMATRFTAADSPNGMFTKLMQLFFKFSGMEWYDFHQRSAAGTYLAKRLALNKGKTIEQLRPQEKLNLSLYGIEGKEWDLFRNEESLVKVRGEQEFITPDGIQTISDEKIKSYLENNDASDREIQTTKDELESRLRSYFIDQTDYANIQPSATDRAFWVRHEAGTFYGELGRFLSQFKMFPTAYVKRLLYNKIKNKDISGLVHLMVASTALGYLSMVTKDILKGIVPRTPNGDLKHDAKIFLAAMAQGGGLGIFGDFLFGEGDRFGHGIISDLVGPVLGTTQDVAKLVLQMTRLESNTGMTALQIAQNNTPFINLFATRTILNYMFLNAIAEHLSPGHTQRMVNNLRRNNDQEFILDPRTHSAGM